VSRPRALAAVLVLVLALTACNPSTTPQVEILTEIAVVELDMATDSGNGYPEAEGPVLEAGVRYEFVAQGTYSIWDAATWSAGTCKGTSEASPMFPSPGGENDRVGLDPEFRFAVPIGSTACSDDSEVIPRHTGTIKMSFDAGASYDDMDPIGGRPTSPSSDHRYRYETIGEGAPFRVRRLDSGNTSDDYGIIRFTIFRVDCAPLPCGAAN
jgi:hypothetical protein